LYPRATLNSNKPILFQCDKHHYVLLMIKGFFVKSICCWCYATGIKRHWNPSGTLWVMVHINKQTTIIHYSKVFGNNNPSRHHYRAAKLTFRCPLLRYGYSYKASCARTG